jgi:hypothetical protein
LDFYKVDGLWHRHSLRGQVTFNTHGVESVFMKCNLLLFSGVVPLVFGLVADAAIQTATECNRPEDASAEFAFRSIPLPAKNDAAAQADFKAIAGRLDSNGGGLDKLHDGRMPSDEDDPSANCFFRAGSDGGRILIDLHEVIDISQINTYSWHPNDRGPQVFQLYASQGTEPGFDAQPARGTHPTNWGWTWLADVDTRKHTSEPGGQYGVSVFDPGGSMGRYRHVLLDISRTETNDAFGHTFYSEIDVIRRDGPPLERVTASVAPGLREIVLAGEGRYQIVIDTTETPDLTDWTKRELVSLVQEWYPKLIVMLSSDGFEPPKRCSIVFSQSMQGVAATSGTRIRCAAKFMRQQLQGEAKGAIFHEMVHVLQQYGRAPKGSPPPPGWLTEGIADCLRWYHYEPQSRGAEIAASKVAQARYDASYRVTANFLHWVCQTYEPSMLQKLNAALRQGKSCEPLWKELTGRTVSELGAEWKRSLEGHASKP